MGETPNTAVQDDLATRPAHTPGPWRVDHHYSCHSLVLAGSAVLFQTNCERGHDGETEESKANARLIAAAPDMLASLKELREAVAACFRVFAMDGHEPQDLEEEFTRIGLKNGFGKRAQDVIAKAEGR